MINAIFTAIGDAVSGFSGALASSVTSITGMFYDATANSGAGQLTVLGTLVLITVGVGLVYWAFKLIKGLLHRA